jgi:hypothetical protein
MCIFSYKNHFGVRVGGSREDNSGDLIITYTDDGTEVNLVQNWSTSHSLTQRSYFDGQYFYTASLGDYHPANIKVLRIDPMLKVEINKNKITQINSYDKNDEFGNNFGQIEQPEQKLDHYTEIQEKNMILRNFYAKSLFDSNIFLYFCVKITQDERKEE